MLFLGNEILLVKISSDSFENKPIKAYTNSAEYDLFADESELVLPNSRKVISMVSECLSQKVTMLKSNLVLG